MSGKRKHDDVLYGVFADSGYERSVSRRRKDKADYSKPVNFVSEIDQNSKEDDVRTAGLGLGFGSASSKKADKEKNEDDDDFLPAAFGKIVREDAKLREEKEKAKKESNPRGVGEFEKHTKGIGMSLFQKMGYKGGGLGKHEQGTVPPIEPKLRPKNMGIGFNHFEDDEKSEIEDVEKSVPRPSQKEKRWSKKVSKKKVDDQELLAQKEERGCEVVQKILDMRGPQVRLLPNLENLNAETKARESDVPMPELQHNIQLIVDIVELDMRSLDNKRETGVALHKEKEKLQKEAHDQEQQLQNMEVIMNVLDQLGDKSSSGSLSLHSLAKSFLDLKTRFAHEYTICNLSCIACSYASPLFITLLQGWNPLQNPTHGIELLKLWKTLLQDEDASNFSPYTQLLIKVVFPAVRISSWKPRDPEPMFRLFDSWEPLLPPSVLQTILDTFVVPMISAAVDSWDPCTETIPIHTGFTLGYHCWGTS